LRYIAFDALKIYLDEVFGKGFRGDRAEPSFPRCSMGGTRGRHPLPILLGSRMKQPDDKEGMMPKTGKGGTPRKEELPATLQRSDQHAQATFAKTYDSAAEEYGDGERAARTAYAALKHGHEKVGDHWEAKDTPGPSYPQAAGGRGTGRSTAGGVDANASKEHLYDLAKRLEVPGRSSMTKEQLVAALQKANDKETRQSRSKK
jgi:hypothetical protein